MKNVILCLIGAAVVAYCDQTVWSYDLTQLPDGWSYTGGWQFDSTGSHVYIQIWSDITGTNSIYTETLLIPEGTDSLTLFIPQFVSGGCNDGFAIARVKVTLNGGASQTVWEEVWYDSYGENSDPITVGLDVSPGDSLSFYFGCDVCVVGSYGAGSIFWNLWDLELVLHGDIQPLPAVTWGEIKSCFQ